LPDRGLNRLPADHLVAGPLLTDVPATRFCAKALVALGIVAFPRTQETQQLARKN